MYDSITLPSPTTAITTTNGIDDSLNVYFFLGLFTLWNQFQTLCYICWISCKTRLRELLKRLKKEELLKLTAELHINLRNLALRTCKNSVSLCIRIINGIEIKCLNQIHVLFSVLARLIVEHTILRDKSWWEITT